MVHTLPPWTTKYRMVKIFGQIDSGELAARLGALSTMDRRGNLIFYDDFNETALHWDTLADGTGASIELNTNYAWIGDKSIKLVTGDATDDTTYLRKTFAPTLDRKIGIEVHIQTPPDGLEFWLIFYGFDGTTRYQGLLTYDAKNDNLNLDYGAGSTVKLGDTIDTLWTHRLWEILKVVFDWETMKYVRVIHNDTEYDVSMYSLQTQASARLPHLSVHLYAVSTANANATMYLDGFILTQNEP